MSWETLSVCPGRKDLESNAVLEKKIIVCRYKAGSFDMDEKRRGAVQFPPMKSGGGIVCKVGKGQQNIFLA